MANQKSISPLSIHATASSRQFPGLGFYSWLRSAFCICIPCALTGKCVFASQTPYFNSPHATCHMPHSIPHIAQTLSIHRHRQNTPRRPVGEFVSVRFDQAMICPSSHLLTHLLLILAALVCSIMFCLSLPLRIVSKPNAGKQSVGQNLNALSLPQCPSPPTISPHVYKRIGAFS